MNSRPVLFNNTVLRDGHQSLAATRMTTQQMLPSLADLDSLGFNALETWGGATIDSCLRYLSENPFDRLRTLKAGAPNTPHMMLLRGQNIVQYTSFPDDIVETFVRCAANAGVDIFRIFDALNDTRNLETAIRAVKAAGKHAQGAVCYTTSPVHTLEALVAVGVELEKMGCHSICIKDMAGLITPPAAFELVKRLKQEVKLPIVLHSHNTAGLATASYYAAIEAGVDIVDVSIAPFANGTGQPDTILMQNLLGGHPRCPSYDLEKLGRLQDYFSTIYQELKNYTSPNNERVDGDILRYQVPGGMLSNFLTQLKEQKMEDKLGEVMKEVLYVREALGWIPLVTPTSQIVGTQAMLNVKFGRWKMIAQQTSDIVLGKYGKTPGKVNDEVREKVCAQTKQQVIDCRPADVLSPKVEAIRNELNKKGMPSNDEMVVLYAMFPQQLEAFLSKKESAEKPISSESKPLPAQVEQHQGTPVATKKMAVTFNSKRFDVMVEEFN